MLSRRKTSNFLLGNVGIGSDYPISIQSMTNTDTRDIKKTLGQIEALKIAGCDIVRLAVFDFEAAEALKTIVKETDLPLIADIHFDYRLALESMENGIKGLRINPGNIGSSQKVKEVVACAKAHDVPIRIGVNAGSLEKKILEKYGKVSSDALVESALGHIELLEKENFKKIKISLKSSNVPLMLESYRKISKIIDYPLHIGVTEAGSEEQGIIKSSVGIGTLLSEGIGDTIRVSLTGDPLQEIPIAKEILKALNLRKEGVEIISCPTCGRTEIDLEELVKKTKEYTKNIKKPIKIAIMGCVVNGPGEAREADLGIAGGKNKGVIFKKGEIIASLKEEELLTRFFAEIDKIKE